MSSLKHDHLSHYSLLTQRLIELHKKNHPKGQNASTIFYFDSNLLEILNKITFNKV